jgi:hypothetical protein
LTRERKEDAMQAEARMDELQVQDYARQLLEARGDKALADAAQKARTLADEGHDDQAETWRRIEAAMKIMRGPHQG